MITDTIKDPRISLFEDLLSIIKEDRPQKPHSITKVPVGQYYDPHWFAHEWSEIFTKNPIVVGVSSMIANPGDHFTNDLLGIPLLVVRGKDGRLRCFHNVCRHRGVRLSNNQTVGSTKTFSCPYHHWTYDLEGRLIFVPAEEGFPDLDKSCYSLKEVPLVEKYGLIWVNPYSDESIDIDDFLGNIAFDVEDFGLNSAHFFKQNIHNNSANWKLHIEAFQDGYHVTRLHNKTVGGFFRDNMAVQEREKDHIRSIVARKGIEEILESSRESWDFRNHGSFSHFIWPNTVIVVHPDYLSQVTFYPLNAEETTIVHNCVINEKATTEKAIAHFEKSFDLIDKGVFSSEDFYVCQQAQKGLKSGANEYFTIGGYESGLRQFHEILFEKTGKYQNKSKA